MTEVVTGAETEVSDVEVKVGKDLTTATLGGTQFDITPDGNVVVFTNEGVQAKPTVITTAATTESLALTIGKDFNSVAMYGAKVERTAEGSFVVSTNGQVKIKPAQSMTP